MALLAAGAELEIRTLLPTRGATYETLKFEDAYFPLASRLKADADLDPKPDAVIVHTLPGDCATVLRLAKDGPGGFTNQPITVAYTTWEALGAPAFIVDAYDVFDEVWHPSIASRDGFRANSPDAVAMRVVPHAFDENEIERRRELVDPGDDGVYRFYYVGAWNGRKNPLGLVRAYAYAFSKNDPVELMLQCAGAPDGAMVQALHSTNLVGQLPPIRFSSQRVTDEEIRALHAVADCFVTATRGEAWNLPCFEAVLAGRHVIAPERQGHEEFLVSTSAAIYLAHRTPAIVDLRISAGMPTQAVGAQGLSSKSLWLEPDLVDLAGCMRKAFADRSRYLTIGYDLAGRFGYRAVGELALGALTTLSDQKGNPRT